MIENKINLRIDEMSIAVPKGTTVLQAARQLGLEIPSMCHFEGLESHTSCMMCLVKDGPSGPLFASCSKPVAEGMNIISKDEEIVEARKTALELLLSDHTGDCEAPCQLGCPAHMDIPWMNRLLQEGKFEEALQVVLEDIPLPSVLGRICPAPCEKVCKRKEIDSPVSICLLKRYAGDLRPPTGSSERSGDPDLSGLQVGASPHTTKTKIAIFGAGPTGLTAAYYLRKKGYPITIFEKESQAGGNLRHPEVVSRLPKAVLDQEIQNILNTGIEIRYNQVINDEIAEQLKTEFKIFLIATGNAPKIETSQLFSGILQAPTVGSAKAGMAIKAIANGKDAAIRIDQILNNQEPTGQRRLFNSRFGKLSEPEFAEYLKESVQDSRIEPDSMENGFSPQEVMKEAARCLHCDCRKLTSCKLRDYSDEYRANQRRFAAPERQLVTKQIQQDLVIYEQAKCIKCGICVRLTEKHKEKFGFTFIGRGFDVQIQIPFGESLAEGLKETAQVVADACPTGAIASQTKRQGPGAAPAPK